MVDVHSPAVRSKNMRAIRSKNTTPELLVRSGLHAAGFRYGLHCRNLPGKPDLVLRKYRTLIYVHGCFWHGHSRCKFFKLPATRPDFWRDKIRKNILNDEKALQKNRAAFWRIAVVWECALKPKNTDQLELLINNLSEWIKSADANQFVEFTAEGGPLPMTKNLSGADYY